MKTITHPQHDRFIGAPSNWDQTRDGPCGALSVHDIPNPPYVATMESAWQPEMVECIAMALGMYHVRLGIIGAATHPPVYMSLRPNAKEMDEDKKVEMYQKLLSELCEHARVNGVTMRVVPGSDGTHETSAEKIAG